ncbi:carboxypeptidase regulatory-like domain-containing protein, partial [Acidobacteriota bacterium]
VVGISPNLVGEVTTVTDNTGSYRLLGLTPGQYEITFTLSGFKTLRHTEIYLKIEQTLVVNIVMEMGIEEEITSLADTPLIDLKSTTQGLTMDREDFDPLPKGRNFDSLMDVIAGTDKDEEYLGGTGVDGASGLENIYYIDGMDTTDALKADQRDAVSAVLEFVEEVQIKSSGDQAEFGGSLGGVVNVVTRSGGNEFHGEVIGYFEGSALKGKERDELRLNPYDNSKAEYVNYQDLYGKDSVQRWEIGFGLGGYFVKDKLWFFGAFLPVFQTTERQVEWLEGDLASGTYKENRKWYNFMAKISAQPAKGLRLAVSAVNNFETYTGELPDRDGAGDSGFAWGDAGFDFPRFTATLTSDWTLSPSLLLSVRTGHNKTDKGNQRVVVDDPRYVFSLQEDNTNAVYPELVTMYPDYVRAVGYENYSRDIGLEVKKQLLARTSANIDLTYFFDLGGEHALKAGFQWIRLKDDLNNTYPYEYFSFGWNEDYAIYQEEGYEEAVKGTYGVYRVSLANEWGYSGTIETDRLAWYIQDSWTIAGKLTINFGVRAEKEEIPAFKEQWEWWEDAKNFDFTWDFFDKFAPRFGAIYNVFGDGSFKIFGNFAIYYDVIKLSLSESAYGAALRVYKYYTLDDPQWWTYGKGNIPGTFINEIWGYRPSFDATDPDMKAVSQREFSLGLEKKISADISGTVRFVRKELLYAIDDLGISKPTGTFWWIGNPGYGVTLNETNGGEFPARYPNTPKAIRDYTAVNIIIEKRMSNNWMGGVNFTCSRLTGNLGGLAATDTSSLFDRWYKARDRNLNVIDGPLATDRPVFLKVYGSYNFDFGLTVGISAAARSGTPVSRIVRAPSSYYPDGFATDGRSPFIFSSDFYAAYNLSLGKNKLQINLNVFNITDTSTSRKIHQYVNQISLRPGDDVMLTGNWNYENEDYVSDPQFLMEKNFFDPIEARIGVKFHF